MPWLEYFILRLQLWLLKFYVIIQQLYGAAFSLEMFQAKAAKELRIQSRKHFRQIGSKNDDKCIAHIYLPNPIYLI